MKVYTSGRYPLRSVEGPETYCRDYSATVLSPLQKYARQLRQRPILFLAREQLKALKQLARLSTPPDDGDPALFRRIEAEARGRLQVVHAEIQRRTLLQVKPASKPISVK